MGYSKEDISLLNSARGLRSLLYKGKVDIDEGLRFARYYQALEKLQKELVQMQTHIIQENKRVVMLFEGRDAAGKGGAIQRFVQFLNPRHYRIIALGKPEDGANQEWYFQRYIEHFPAPGEMVFFDRSWYNRAGVEKVMSFCNEEDIADFYKSVPQLERMFVNSGIKLIKYWFSVSDEEQQFRFYCRINDPLKQWKLSPMDLQSRIRWEDYTKAKEVMFKKTNISEAPWYTVPADDKMSARLNCIAHILSLFPYKPVPKEKVLLPSRKRHEGYQREKFPKKMVIPQVY